MKKLKYLFQIAFVSLTLACSSEDDEPKLVEKDVTIDIEMRGDYSKYLVTFSVHSMLAETSTFVAPMLGEPSDLDWTQVVEQGNTYTLSFEPESSRLSATSSVPIHSLGFVFNAVPLDREPDEPFEVLTATIRVFADGEVYREYAYEASPSDQTSVPISESVTVE
ncbi:hypothetical protein U3A58_10250 [Algoriphagus sp. C2-6-M1]|uniref:hypothetical protein n=1 Tax=Algoriphagus persicinus TaxID=3108754 RepID=UPI002B3F9C81|nr:hypothetical protein [Algoriphagus sp. C2-6-M1]MEB2780774.1 hypothetical protein [Algoriphagus sp. C2-6-M1]